MNATTPRYIQDERWIFHFVKNSPICVPFDFSLSSPTQKENKSKKFNRVGHGTVHVRHERNRKIAKMHEKNTLSLSPSGLSFFLKNIYFHPWLLGWWRIVSHVSPSILAEQGPPLDGERDPPLCDR
jgi:hypothetical protein